MQGLQKRKLEQAILEEPLCSFKNAKLHSWDRGDAEDGMKRSHLGHGTIHETQSPI
jgi:hypothetical protein